MPAAAIEPAAMALATDGMRADVAGGGRPGTDVCIHTSTSMASAASGVGRAIARRAGRRAPSAGAA